VSDASVAAVIVAPAAALVGVGLGKFLDSMTEGKKWRREQRSGSYVGFLAAAELVNLELCQKAEDYDANRVRDAQAELTRTAAGVDVFGSSEAAKIAHDLWNYVAIDLDVREVQAMTDEDWAPCSDKIRAYIKSFRDQARVDLKGQALPASIATGEPAG